MKPIVILRGFESPREYRNESDNLNVRKIVEKCSDPRTDLQRVFCDNMSIFTHSLSTYSLKIEFKDTLDLDDSLTLENLSLYYIVDGIFSHQKEYQDNTRYEMLILIKNDNRYHSLYLDMTISTETSWFGFYSQRTATIKTSERNIQIDSGRDGKIHDDQMYRGPGYQASKLQVILPQKKIVDI